MDSGQGCGLVYILFDMERKYTIPCQSGELDHYPLQLCKFPSLIPLSFTKIIDDFKVDDCMAIVCKNRCYIQTYYTKTFMGWVFIISPLEFDPTYEDRKIYEKNELSEFNRKFLCKQNFSKMSGNILRLNFAKRT
ncbi:hypothetical protein RF11_06744 [Thelohanellus kitauei]|uniref:Uncharacterized protein n=1 Tax=Thelohanellus kitauei TaxID=669202 RepID=A0A0C2N322_THEKT|nr:hypothetical protein RF11_06744 [Thelohanellus kitauei]